MTAAGRALELVRGTVEQTNGTGIKVGGEWLNVSRFRPVDISAIQRGQLVSASVERNERGAYLRELDVVGSAPEDEAVGNTATKLAVLSAAATFAAGRPEMKSADVLTLAERWLAWVEQSA